MPLSAIRSYLRQQRETLRSSYAYLGDDLGLVKLWNGYLLYVDTRDIQVTPHLIARGSWEPHVERALWHLVKPGQRIVEVGANLGYYTVQMASAVGPTGRVLAIEASARHAALVRNSIDVNGYTPRAEVRNIVAGEAKGTVSFALSRRAGASGHLVQTPGAVSAHDAEVVTLEADTLDSIAGSMGPIDLLRMDAEGSEPFIIAGARELLRASPNLTVVTEWTPVMMHDKSRAAAFVQTFVERGATFSRIDPQGRLQPIAADRLLDVQQCELVIQPRGS